MKNNLILTIFSRQIKKNNIISSFIFIFCLFFSFSGSILISATLRNIFVLILFNIIFFVIFIFFILFYFSRSELSIIKSFERIQKMKSKINSNKNEETNVENNNQIIKNEHNQVIKKILTLLEIIHNDLLIFINDFNQKKNEILKKEKSDNNIFIDTKSSLDVFLGGDQFVKNISNGISNNVDEEMKFSNRLIDKINDLITITKETIKENELLYNNSDMLISFMQEIENISSKIHILSLNASITAARSGEAGKPFMVVAKEIRGLSENVKSSVERMKKHSNSLRFSIKSVSESINKIGNETESTQKDFTHLLDRFSGINLSLNIIDRKIQNNIENLNNVMHSLSNKIENQNSNSIFDEIRIDYLHNLLDSLKREKSIILTDYVEEENE